MSEKQNSIRLLTEGKVWKVMLVYAAPIFIGNLFQQLYNTADSLIVGNFVGQDALAAVSSVGSLLFLFIGFFNGFATGASVVIAREIGARHRQNTVEAVHTTFLLGILLGLAMTFIGAGISPTVLRWMGTPDEVYPLAVTYTRIYFEGSLALVMYNMLVGILRAGGDSRHPLYYLIVSSLVNIVMDIVLIVVFHMGVAGAAAATVGSEFLSMILCGIRLFRDDSELGLRWSDMKLTPSVLKEIAVFGIPTGLQGCVIDLANIMIQSYINSFGSAAAAGIGAYAKIEGFMFLPVTAFSMALTTFISQNKGAGKEDRVRESIRFGINASTIMVETIGVIIFFFAPQFIAAFNRSPDVIAYGVSRARTCAFFYCLLSFSHVVSAICRGEGKPVMPMAVMLVCWCAVRVITLMTLGQVIHDIRLANWL